MELYFYDEEKAYLESNKYIDVQNAAVRAYAGQKPIYWRLCCAGRGFPAVSATRS